MTPERLHEIITSTNIERSWLARMLGYSSEAALRQVEEGRVALAEDKAEWLERYARFRAQQDADAIAWLRGNPPP
jgi:hypothetical protein